MLPNLRGEFISRVELEKVFGEVAGGILQVIKASSLTTEQQNDLRRQISSIQIRIKDVAAHQRNGSRNGDGVPLKKTKPKVATAKKAPAKK